MNDFLGKAHTFPPFFLFFFGSLLNIPYFPHLCPAGRSWILLDPLGCSLISSLLLDAGLAVSLRVDRDVFLFQSGKLQCSLC